MTGFFNACNPSQSHKVLGSAEKVLVEMLVYIDEMLVY